MLVAPITNETKSTQIANKLEEMEALLLEQMKNNDDPYQLWNQIK